MPSVHNSGPGLGSYVSSSDTAQTSTDPIAVDASGLPANPPPPPATSAASPIAALTQGVSGIVMFPGKLIVQQFIGAGDPLDMSHLPVTLILSACFWYGAYWYFFQHKGSAPLFGHIGKHKRNED